MWCAKEQRIYKQRVSDSNYELTQHYLSQYLKRRRQNIHVVIQVYTVMFWGILMMSYITLKSSPGKRFQ